ncbi:MAG: DUF6293 family protein [archaeon]
MKTLYMMVMAPEREMIIKTVFKSGADKVCMLCPEQKKDYRAKSDAMVRGAAEEILPKLKEFTEVDTVSFRFNDAEQIMENVIRYIKQNIKEHDIILNVSLGSHFVCTVLLNIAAIFNLRVQYTFMEELNPKLITQEDWHFGFNKVVELPTIPTNIALSKKEVEFLRQLEKKESMIVQDYISMYPKKDENKRRAEFNYYTEKFQKMNFISIKKVCHRNIIVLTNTGKMILSIED